MSHTQWCLHRQSIRPIQPFWDLGSSCSSGLRAEYVELHKMAVTYSKSVSAIIFFVGSNANTRLPEARPGTGPRQSIKLPQMHKRITGPTEEAINQLDRLVGEDRAKHEIYVSSWSTSALSLAQVSEQMQSLTDTVPQMPTYCTLSLSQLM